MGPSHPADWTTEPDWERILPSEGYLGRPSETLFPWLSLPKWETSSKFVKETESWNNHFLYLWASLGISNLDPSCTCGFLITPGSSESASSATPTCHQQESRCAAHIRVLQPRADGLTGQRLWEFSIHWSTHGSVDKNQGCLGPTLSLWVCLNARWVSYSVTKDYGLAFHRTRTLSSVPFWSLKSQQGSGFIVLGAWAPWGCPCEAFLLFLSWARQNSSSRRPSPAGVKTLPSSGSYGSSRDSAETIVPGLPTLDKVLDLQAFLVLG